MAVVPHGGEPGSGPDQVVLGPAFLPGETAAVIGIQHEGGVFGVAGDAGHLVELAEHLQESGIRVRLGLPLLQGTELGRQAKRRPLLQLPHPGEAATLQRRVIATAVRAFPSSGLVVVDEPLDLRRRIGGVLLKENSKKFIKPTKSDIENYCKESNLQIDADYFIDYYEGMCNYLIFLRNSTPYLNQKYFHQRFFY